MGRVVKGMLGAPIAGAALQSEDSEAGVILKNGIPYIQSYHGGPAGIENFDLRYIGSGEGAQVFGWGLYSGDNIKTGSRYKQDRQHDYDREFKNAVETDTIDYHHMRMQPIELRVGGASQPFYIDAHRYSDIVNEQVNRYGPNIEAVKDGINRSLTKEDMLRADRMRNLSSEWDNNISGLPLYKDQFTTFNTERAEWRVMAQKTLSEFYGDSLDELTDRIFESVADEVPLEAQSFEELGQRIGYEWYDLAMARLLKAEERFARRQSLDRYEYSKERAQAFKRAQERGISADNRTNNPAYVQYNTPPPDPDGFDFEYVKPSSFPDDIPDQIIDLEKMSAGGRKASLYEVITDARPEEILRWDIDIRDQPPFMQAAIQKAMKNLYEATLDYPERFEGTGLYNASGFGASGLERVQKTIKRMSQGDFQKGLNGASIIELLSPPGRTNRKDWGMGVIAPQELSLLLSDSGVKGLAFPDGWTRAKKGEKDYNYVWYRDDIHQLKELGFALPITLASMAGVGTIAAGAPLVSKEIAERFPLPQEEQGYLDRVTDPETYKNALAPYVPALQFFGNNIAEGLQPLEYPARGLAAAGRAGLTLSQGGSLREARDGLLDTLMKPYEETSQEAGEYVLKQTNSPALATGAYMGMILADPSNYVGP